MGKNINKNEDKTETDFERLREGLQETLVGSVETIDIGEYLAPEKMVYTGKELETIKDDFFRFHIFILLFDGNIDNWLLYLETMASEKLKNETLPFVLHLKNHIESDPTLIDKIKGMVLSEICSLKEWDKDSIALFKKTEEYKKLEKTRSSLKKTEGSSK